MFTCYFFCLILSVALAPLFSLDTDSLRPFSRKAQPVLICRGSDRTTSVFGGVFATTAMLRAELRAGTV